MNVAMVASRLAATVGTGLAGAVAYDGIKRAASSAAARQSAVVVTSWGLRAVRAAEIGTERARLTLGDIVSEARERVGEQAPAPGTTTGQADTGHAH